MKHIIFFFLLFPFISHAATLTLSTGAAEARAGERVSVAIDVDAGEERIVTVRAALSYPEDLLEFMSFSFAPEAFALSQPGYDAEGGGTLVKTAGFPGGFTGTRPFGVAEFIVRARSVSEAGSSRRAAISVSSDSLLLNAQGVNRLTVATTVTLSVAAPIPLPEPSPLPQSAALTPAPGVPVPSFESVTTTTEVSDQSAAVVSSAVWKNPLVITLLSLFAVGILATLAWYTIR